MPENDKAGTEEIFSLYCVQDGQNIERKSLRCPRKPLLSASMAQKRLEKSNSLLNDLKITGIEFIFSYDKTFTVDPVFNKQNNQIVAFENVS